jgi:hypothetical protein
MEAIRMVEQKAFGTYNATGPAHPLTVAEMLYGIKAVTTAGAQFTWVPATFLEAQKVQPWSDMPVWIPPVGEEAGFASVSIQRALDKGLTFRRSRIPRSPRRVRSRPAGEAAARNSAERGRKCSRRGRRRK